MNLHESIDERKNFDERELSLTYTVVCIDCETKLAVNITVFGEPEKICESGCVKSCKVLNRIRDRVYQLIQENISSTEVYQTPPAGEACRSALEGLRRP